MMLEFQTQYQGKYLIVTTFLDTRKKGHFFKEVAVGCHCFVLVPR